MTLRERAAVFRAQEIKTIGIADPLLALEAYFSEPREDDAKARAALSLLREELEWIESGAAPDVFERLARLVRT